MNQVFGRCAGPCDQLYVAAAMITRRQMRQTISPDGLRAAALEQAHATLMAAWRWCPRIVSRPERPLGFLVGVERWLGMTDQERSDRLGSAELDRFEARAKSGLVKWGAWTTKAS